MKKRIILYSLLIVLMFIICGCSKTVTITFNTDGGSPINDITINRDSSITILPAAHKTGYSFLGWYIEGQKVTTENTFSKDVTLVAEWLANSNTVTFVDFQGKVIETKKVLTGNIVEAPEYTPIEGYTFVGWDKSLRGITEDTTITAKCIQNQYSITFDSNGGEIVTIINKFFGEVVVKPKDPTKTGCFFAGWYTDKELTKLYHFTTMPASNITLYAKWDEVKVDYVSLYLDEIYKDKNPSTNYELPSIINVFGKTFTLSWSIVIVEGNSDVSIALNNGVYIVTINSQFTVNCKYNLIVEIIDGNDTITNTYERSLEK